MTKIYEKWLKIDYEGQYLLKGSTVHFANVDLFVNLTLLNIIPVYSLSLSIIIFKIITKNGKNFIKITNSGAATQQPVVRFI